MPELIDCPQQGGLAADSDSDLDALPPGTRERVAGVIVAAACLVLTILWLLSGGGSEFIRPKIHLYTYLNDTGGLAPGADILLNGVTAGQVAAIRLAHTNDPQRVIWVDLKIERRFKDQIPVDSIAALTADNLLGDKFVNINIGKGTAHVEDGSEIASLVETGSFNPADLVTSLHVTLGRLDAILDEIRANKTPLAQFVNGDALYVNLETQVEEIQRAIQTAAGPKTQMGQMLFSPAAYNQIRQPILNVDRMLEAIERGENGAGRFLTDSKPYDKAVAQIHNIHTSLSDLNDGKGKSGAFLKTDEQYARLQSQVDSLNKKLDNLLDPHGKFGQQLASRKLYDSLAAQSRGAGMFMREFREDPRRFERIKLFGKKKTAPKQP